MKRLHITYRKNQTFIIVALFSSALLLAVTGPARAGGKLEELLAIPAVQALLNKQVDLTNSLGLCKDNAYAKKNAVACQHAQDAQNLARLSPELRSILTKPILAGSIRDLCSAAYGTPKQNTVLCAELYVADPGFEADLARTKAAEVEANKARN